MTRNMPYQRDKRLATYFILLLRERSVLLKQNWDFLCSSVSLEEQTVIGCAADVQLSKNVCVPIVLYSKILKLNIPCRVSFICKIWFGEQDAGVLKYLELRLIGLQSHSFKFHHSSIQSANNLLFCPLPVTMVHHLLGH